MTPSHAQRITPRQIHLDFHTSEHLSGLGEGFSKRQFQEALKAARVTGVNLFAKCHHSWSYYPTAVGRMHPHLEFDLLGAQIEACHEVGILAPIYYTFGWSATDAEEHPEWCARNRDGSHVANGNPVSDADPEAPMPAFCWKFLCANTRYHDHIMAQVEELCRRYPVDGFWFDIYQVHRLCFCEACSRGMKSEGVDPDDTEAVEAFNARNMKRHCRALRELIARHHPGASVFFNGTTAIDTGANFRHRMYQHNTVQDLEDLPTVWGGYDKLPLQSKFFIKAGWPITAMSGKFHTAWGEFGGFKHPAALKYEAASMIAWGANCNFGDQLHPSGKMDESTYGNIAEAYAYVQQIEAYGIGGQPVARLGLWRSFDQEHDEGLVRILLEAHVNFDVANFSDDFSEFDGVLIPGCSCLEDADASRLSAFAANGGFVIAMGKGAFGKKSEDPLLDIGADYLGEGLYDIDYLVADECIAAGLVGSPFLNYEPTLRINPHPGTEVLAAIHEPYFSRTQATYTSHQNTPYKIEAADHPGVIRKGNIIYIAPELDAMYLKHGARLHRDLFINILKCVHTRPMVTTELPSAGRISLLHQPDQHRYVIHLLYAPPIKRGECEVIEDLPPLQNVPLLIDLPRSPLRARMIPEDVELPFVHEGGKLHLTLPTFSCHCAVVLEYSPTDNPS